MGFWRRFKEGAWRWAALLGWALAAVPSVGLLGRSTGVVEGGVFYPIDPAAYGRSDPGRWSVWAFSQADPSERDPQLLALAPDVVPRAWTQWDRTGLAPRDYDFGYPAACRFRGIRFVGGVAGSFFQEEVGPEAFQREVSRDVAGRPFKDPYAGFDRASLASPGYRDLLVSIGEAQLDGGVDGLFYDEVNGVYASATGGGYDDATLADFASYLMAKHPGLSPDQWALRYRILPDDGLLSSAPAHPFDYRGYLQRNGWDGSPLGPGNPLAADWGSAVANRPYPPSGSFTDCYPTLVYWQQIVVALRTYARRRYGKEILITANGVFPFVDFQSVGIYDYNHDGPGGASVDYVPVSGGHLDGSVSLQQAFLGLKERSLRVAGRTVPVVLFLDWPTPSLNRYNALPPAERRDYWRLYAAEAYADGLYFAFHLKTTTGEPTAARQGMLPFFKAYAAYLRAHAALYHGARDVGGPVALSAPNVVWHLTRLADGREVVHLVNHNYARGFRVLRGVQVALPFPRSPRSVIEASPDRSGDRAVRFTYAQGRLRIVVPRLDAYSALVVD